MEAGNPNRDTNSLRERVLSVLRCAEAGINRGIIPRTIQSSTVTTAQMVIPPIETCSIQAEHHLVSTVTVYADLIPAVDTSLPQIFQVLQRNRPYERPRELESLWENVDIRQLDDRWLGEILSRDSPQDISNLY